jgi:DNA repair ATPase RecN
MKNIIKHIKNYYSNLKEEEEEKLSLNVNGTNISDFDDEYKKIIRKSEEAYQKLYSKYFGKQDYLKEIQSKKEEKKQYRDNRLKELKIFIEDFSLQVDKIEKKNVEEKITEILEKTKKILQKTNFE